MFYYDISALYHAKSVRVNGIFAVFCYGFTSRPTSSLGRLWYIGSLRKNISRSGQEEKIRNKNQTEDTHTGLQ